MKNKEIYTFLESKFQKAAIDPRNKREKRKNKIPKG
ncbi:hypothetical protein AsAng_0012600 [Aureispira anguillae]|uniref:Uncharacterized protein n=1 Tax=Aureispira anguillae TaxID=2864201 RepID=A0A915YCH9_9BACT|nr:hypothetical protein AsAng_0012600 [Aureispira anguillae]